MGIYGLAYSRYHPGGCSVKENLLHSFGGSEQLNTLHQIHSLIWQLTTNGNEWVFQVDKNTII